MSAAELRARSIFRMYHLNKEKREVKHNLMILLSADSSCDDSITSMATEESDKECDLYTCFHGSWGENTTVDDYCSQLRDGITEPKEIEAW